MAETNKLVKPPLAGLNSRNIPKSFPVTTLMVLIDASEISMSVAIFWLSVVIPTTLGRYFAVVGSQFLDGRSNLHLLVIGLFKIRNQVLKFSVA